MNKLITVIAISVAILAAAISAIFVSVNRTAVAKAIAETAASEEAKAEAEKRTAVANEAAEAEKRRAAEANAKAAADKLKTTQLEKEKAEADARAAESARKEREAEADRAEMAAVEAREKKEAAKLAAETSRNEKAKAESAAKTASAKAEAEASRLATEKLKADKIISEAKLLELQKIDFEAVQQTLIDWKLDLEERERALKPEKTIADLAWAGGAEDSIVDEHGNLKKQEKKAYDPEKDLTLPAESRELARQNRLMRERQAEKSEAKRAEIVARMEGLYVTALKDKRTVDAEFYRKTLKTLYPDWNFKGEEEKK